MPWCLLPFGWLQSNWSSSTAPHTWHMPPSNCLIRRLSRRAHSFCLWPIKFCAYPLRGCVVGPFVRPVANRGLIRRVVAIGTKVFAGAILALLSTNTPERQREIFTICPRTRFYSVSAVLTPGGRVICCHSPARHERTHARIAGTRTRADAERSDRLRPFPPDHPKARAKKN
jgi:hypothetical protein